MFFPPGPPPAKRFKLSMSAIVYMDFEIQAASQFQAINRAMEAAFASRQCQGCRDKGMTIGEWNVDTIEEME